MTERHGTIVVSCEDVVTAADTLVDALAIVRVEVAVSNMPPTVTIEDELPEQCEVGVRYPLMRIDRAHAGAWALFVYWLALLRWRWRMR